jgi:hypothetical protein
MSPLRRPNVARPRPAGVRTVALLVYLSICLSVYLSICQMRNDTLHCVVSGRKKRRAPSQPATIVVVDDTKPMTPASGVTVVAVEQTPDLPVAGADCDPGQSTERVLSAEHLAPSTVGGAWTTTPFRAADQRPASPAIELTSWRLSSFDPSTRLSAAVPLHRTSRSDDLTPTLASLGGEH